ncbi:MAG: hypothetical protein LW854_22225 [Rubrivivax sp.]|nr:hypothetical protein [Rubrivivax sp.]
MTLTAIVPQRELAFQADQLYEGLSYKLFLALNPGTLDAEDDLADWEAAACSGGGYAAATGTIGTGSWNATTGRYEPPVLTISVTATGAGFSFDTIVCKVGTTRTNVQSLTVLPGMVALAAGQSRTYVHQLAQDN